MSYRLANHSNHFFLIIDWIKKNLFSTWYNTILTIVSSLCLWWISRNLINWIFTQAQWEVISTNLRLFFAGQYPLDLLWRPWTSLGVIISMSGFSWGLLARNQLLFNTLNISVLGILAVICALLAVPISITSSLKLLGILTSLIIAACIGKKIGQKLPSLVGWLPFFWLLIFFILLWLLEGGWLLRPVRLDSFSGLILTILTAVVSIILSFPFGVLLAIGRQSSLPVIRWLSVIYIELIRGLPLIGILFMAQVMLPLILPEGIRIERVIRAIAGFTLFSAAYLAENVRGGLQSIPNGQIEAAKALGLNSFWVLSLVVLPQALKIVIPTIVGQFISLFKDTSLLVIVGFSDLLGISRSILANPKFIGRDAEVYLFIAVIYWVFCYSMSFASRQLEQKLNTHD